MIQPIDTTSALGNGAIPPGAAAALAGYDYQLGVSILAALRILLITKSASRITLEPANADDIEVDLEDDDPGHVETTAQLGVTARLIMQVKMRSGDPWSIDAFERLLKHGKRRTPAKDQLTDPDIRYLLVTNADVSGVARGLLVRDFEEQPERNGFPESLRKILPSAPDGRVAIYASLSERLLKYEIEHILTAVLRVPMVRQESCLTALREEAQARMRGTLPGVWTRSDLLGTVRRFGGFLASVAELDAFVEPTNFSEMIRQLENRHAIVLTGSSGTGKTLTASALCDEARKRNGALEIVVVNPNGDPSSIRQLVQTGPKLFYLEDPWGQNSLRNGSEMWTEQLPRMLRGAHSGSQFVITSRSDMLRAAQAINEVAPWSITLEADCYLSGRLARIYDKRMDQLPPELQSQALSFRSDVLRSLEKPLELDLFFANIISGRGEGENSGEWLARLIGLAHRDAVEGVVARHLAHADVRSQSAVIWGVLAARGSFDRTQLLALMRSLRNVDPNLATDLDKLIDHMVAARHLRQPTTTVAFAHPSVRAGFEKHLIENWFRYEPAFSTVLVALTNLSQMHFEWGMETAARLIDEGRRLTAGVEGGSLAFDVPFAARTRIDQWLDAALVAPDVDFPSILQLASDVGSEESIPSELARWLLTSVQRGADFFIPNWDPPSFSDAWYERISKDPRSFLIAERFVRDQLAEERGSYRAGFPSALDRITTGLEGAYLYAARGLVGMGHGPNVDAVVTGALRDLTAFKVVFEEALDDLRRDETSIAEEAERWRAIEDGECDLGFEEYYSSGFDDDGYASRTIIERYIEAIRSVDDWRSLAEHERASEFGHYWAHAIRDADDLQTVAPEELAAMFEAAEAGGHKYAAWEALHHHWHQGFRKRLGDDLSTIIADVTESRAAMDCAMSVDRTLLAEVFERLPTSSERITFLCDLIDARRVYSRSPTMGLRSLAGALDPSYSDIGRHLLRGTSTATSLGSRSIEVLIEAAQAAPPRTLSKIIPILINRNRVPNGAILRWLTETSDKHLAEEAAVAATAVKDMDAVASALQHPRANARAVALEWLSGRSAAPLPSNLLALCTDPGRRVRHVLVRALAAKTHASHIPVLLRLVGDTWSDADHFYNEPESFPIARDAAKALASYAPLSDHVSNDLIISAVNTKDRGLSQDCLQVAAAHGSPAIRRKIISIAEGGEGGWVRLDALDSLIFASQVEPDLLAPLTDVRVRKLGPALAASATVLVCHHAPIQDAVSLCERMANSNADRSLAVLGACVLHERAPEAALAILDLLPEAHPARHLFSVQDELLPASILDGLGDIKRRRWVQKWLTDRVAKT